MSIYLDRDSKRKQKILMVMYGMKTGGAELQFLELAKELHNEYNLHVVGIGNKGNLKRRFDESQIPCHVLPFDGKFDLILSFFRFFFFAFKFKPDAMISTSHIANVFVFLLYPLFRNSLSMQTVSKCMAKREWLDRFVLKRFKVLIAGADDIKSYLIQLGMTEERIVVVRNWVDISQRIIDFENLEKYKKSLLGDNNILISSIGRLHVQKGHEFLLEAVRFIEGDFKLVIAGDGDQREMLENKIKKLNLEDKVSMIGEVDEYTYDLLLSATDIYVQPSLFEGLPRTLLDAMFHQKTIIATNVNGNVEALSNTDIGVLVPPKNPLSLADAINSILNKVNSSGGNFVNKNARNRILNDFEMNKQISKIKDLILC